MRLVRAGWVCVQTVGVLLVMVSVVWLVLQFGLQLKILNVQTGSMRPSFQPGDALILQKQPATNLRIGTVVSYHSPRNPNELVTHRVVRTMPGSFQTKGDALATPDPTVRDSLLVGKVILVLPGLGKVLSWVQTIPGLITFVYVPALTITAQELVRLEHWYDRRRRYLLTTA